MQESPAPSVAELDEAVEQLRQRAQLSEGWIPWTEEERKLCALATDLIVELNRITPEGKTV